MKKSITPTDEQIRQMADIFRHKTPECVSVALQQMRTDGHMTKEELQRALGRANQLSKRLIPLLKELIRQMAEENDLLKRIWCFSIPELQQFPVRHLWTNTEGINIADVTTFIRLNYGDYSEPKVADTAIEVCRLLRRVRYDELSAEFPNRNALTYSQVYWLLKQQPQGEKPNGITKILSVDGSKNYLRVQNYQQHTWSACLVVLDWKKGWNINEILFSDEWIDEGAQVINKV